MTRRYDVYDVIVFLFLLLFGYAFRMQFIVYHGFLSLITMSIDSLLELFNVHFLYLGALLNIYGGYTYTQLLC